MFYPLIIKNEFIFTNLFLNTGIILAFIVAFLIIVFLISSCFVIVKQQSFSIIERFGKYRKTALAGFHFLIPFIDKVAGNRSLKVIEVDVPVETMTKDNVFVVVRVSNQFYVKTDAESIYNSFYKLNDPTVQIKSYVYDVVRSTVPKLLLDDVFDKKEDIAIAVKNELSETMSDFGYGILNSLVTDIEPDKKVKDAMNEINASQRLRIAAGEKGEAEKILKIKQAEAEAESKKLQGQGIANQRMAIINGLKESVESLKEATGVDSLHVMSLIMMTQYFDTLKELGAHKVLMMPHSPGGISDIRSQIISAIELEKDCQK